MSAPGTAPGAPCPPPAANTPPVPCGPPGPNGPPPDCKPGADGAINCAPPPQCGGSAFGGAGAAGCAPPDFCHAKSDGTYDCKPPEDCRTTPDGRSRCAPPPVGAACQRQLQGAAAEGAFVPCAPPPTQFCPPPPPGQPPQCGAPPAPPHFCAEGEAMFPPDHPAGAPPVCMPAPRVDVGVDGRQQYRPPIDLSNAGGNCVPPPGGEWPPAQPAPEGKVWCPPVGFAPPPPPGEGFQAWKDFAKDKVPQPFQGYMFDNAHRWDQVNGSALADITAAGAVHQLFAPPAFDGRLVNGSFTRAQLDEGMGLRNFSVAGTPFFRDVRPGLGSNATLTTAAGTAVLAANDHAVFETHNTPAGTLAYRGVGEGGFPVHFDAGADNATPPDITKLADDLHVIQRGDWKGVLIGHAEQNGSALDATVGNGSPVFFMAIPPTGLEAETRLDIAKGVADNKVFGEISLVARNDTVAQDLTIYDDPGSFAVNVTNITDDAVALDVHGEGTGQALVFTVDRETLTTPLADMNVTIDGHVMTECDSFENMTESAASGGCFYVTANESVVRVSVMPEHFSDHTIVIGALPAPAIPATTSSDTSTSKTQTSATPPAATPTATPAGATKTSAPTNDVPMPGALAIVAIVAVVAWIGRRKP